MRVSVLAVFKYCACVQCIGCDEMRTHGVDLCDVLHHCSKCRAHDDPASPNQTGTHCIWPITPQEDVMRNIIHMPPFPSMHCTVYSKI